jgi:hypothetical protein
MEAFAALVGANANAKGEVRIACACNLSQPA